MNLTQEIGNIDYYSSQIPKKTMPNRELVVLKILCNYLNTVGLSLQNIVLECRAPCKKFSEEEFTDMEDKNDRVNKIRETKNKYT